MTIVNVLALAVSVVLYVSVYADTWQDRYLARICLGSALAVIVAVTM
jgi:hypothetical protein